ncbi:hypothetical protein NXY11_00990 [Parabacteroides faecis]|nr:hypothetical protein [Parabacteroides faecis]UVQ46855.1 hypothetical protein NXY11_00990 [Parabacteroides faecis]
MKDYLNLNGSLSIYLGRKQNKKKATAGFASDNRFHLMWKM